MTATLSALLVLVPAPTPDEVPAGAPPALQYLRCDDKGAIEYTHTVTRNVQEVRQVVENVNGQVVARAVTVVVPTTVTEKRLIDPKGVEVYDLDGKKVDAADWQKVLKSGAVVAVAGDGNLPHAAYRKALKAGTLVVVMKSVPGVLRPPATN